MQIPIRTRRNRKFSAIRELVAETNLTIDDVLAPLFFCDGKNIKDPINSMPGQFRFSTDLLLSKISELEQLGIKGVSLFPVIDNKLKTPTADEAFNKIGLNADTINKVKSKFPNMLVMSDIALDPYSSDGHDGLVDKKTGEILNDETLALLARMAVLQAQAGSDIVGPSDMMDGRVGVIRSALDEANFKNTSIMAYSAKYASAFYGPFRDALDSQPKSGDKKTYQMDYRNSREAIRELDLDVSEGADIVMVKPGISYLDIVSKFAENCELPIAVYNVSGEYAMVKAAAERGWIDGEAVMLEMLTSFKRAGADIILTYFAEELAKMKCTSW